jgi:hypothetical protein
LVADTLERELHLPSIYEEKWCVERPGTMVVACSDGRLQRSLDAFLKTDLGIHDYDRLFVPGGAGALVAGGFEFLRSEQTRRDLLFLVERHKTQELILLVHGAAEDGPPEATCAHYERIMPHASLTAVRDAQVHDIHEFQRSAHRELKHLRVRGYRAEVTADLQVRYVEIAG